MRCSVTAALAALFVVAGCSIVRAETTTTPDWTFSGNAAFKSRYMGTFFGTACTDHPVFQFDLTAAHKSGWYLGGWINVPTEERFQKSAKTELDYIIGRSDSIMGGRAKLDVSTCVFDLAKLGDLTGDYQSIDIDLAASHGKVRPFAHMDYTWALDSTAAPGGWTWSWGARSAFRAGRQPINATLRVFGNGGVFHCSSEAVSAVRLNFSATRPLGHKQSVTYDVGYQAHVGGGRNSITPNSWVGSITYSF